MLINKKIIEIDQLKKAPLMDFDCRMMLYDLSHLLLDGVWVNQVQDPYLTMLPYLGL